jgi:hypothetical protein
MKPWKGFTPVEQEKIGSGQGNFESRENLLQALLITQILKNDY